MFSFPLYTTKGLEVINVKGGKRREGRVWGRPLKERHWAKGTAHICQASLRVPGMVASLIVPGTVAIIMHGYQTWHAHPHISFLLNKSSSRVMGTWSWDNTLYIEWPRSVPGSLTTFPWCACRIDCSRKSYFSITSSCFCYLLGMLWHMKMT